MTTFTDLVGRLWTQLGLGTPVFSETGSAINLEVDGRRLTLATSHDEAGVLVRGSLGRVAQDAATRAGQSRRLLQVNLGLALLNGSVAHLRPGRPGAPPTVEVTGLSPCRADALPELIQIIEDVLQMLDAQGAELERHGALDHGTGQPKSLDVTSDHVIIRL